jgi:hypothetical protein
VILDLEIERHQPKTRFISAFQHPDRPATGFTGPV